MGTGKGLLDSLIAEGGGGGGGGGVKSRDLSWMYIAMGVDIEILGGVGVIGLQLNFTAIPTSLFI